MADEAVDLVAAGDLDIEDLEVLGRIAAMIEDADPVPAGLVDQIRVALALETLDDDIVELAESSRAMEAVRSGSVISDNPVLTFDCDSVSMVLRVHRNDEDIRLDGWIAPGNDWLVEVQQENTTRSVPAENGRFSVTNLASGPVRLIARRDEGEPAAVSCRAEL